MTTPILNEFGRMLRIMRLDINERLMDMAKNAGISSAYLSSMEMSRKEIPASVVEKIIKEYKLTDELADKLFLLASKANKKVSVNLTEMDDEKGIEAMTLFARHYSQISADAKKQVAEIIKRDVQPTSELQDM